MTIYPMILLLIVPGQDNPKPDFQELRARRAAIVEGIMAQPMILKPRLEAPGNADGPPDVERKRAARVRTSVQVRVFNEGGATRSLTIEQPNLAEPDGEVDAPEPAPIGFNLNNSALERENFDRWIFGDGIDEESRRIRLQSALTEKIDRVMKDRDINPAQLRKLRLAGSGDIKRFLDRVDECRPEFEVARKSFNAGYQFLLGLQPLSKEFQDGPFGEDSFFAKTLKKIVDDSKAAPKNGR